MNAAQVHLALNHLPIFATLFGAGLLVWGVWRGQEVQKRLGLMFFVIAALTAVPVYLSGEPAEEIVEHRPGVSEKIIHPHEEAAELAFVAVGILGTISLLMLFLLYRGRNIPRVGWTVSIVAGVFTLLLFLRAAHLGGQIRHDELRAVTAVSESGHSDRD